MTPTKLLVGQILLVFAIMVLGVWAATQWAAAMLANQPGLGLPWFRLSAISFYHPWSLFLWWCGTARPGEPSSFRKAHA